MTTHIFDRIISRTYELKEDGKVTLSVFKPRSDGDDIVCDFKITGLSKDIESYAFGIDEIQAVFLALTKASNFLYTSEEYKLGELKWLNSLDLGLPVVPSISEILNSLKQT